MRKLLASGCCAVYLVFGFIAGAAHVHESADHHDQARGLHVDHSHLGDTADHEHEHEHDEHDEHEPGHGSTQQPEAPEADNAHLEARHVSHHDGDALYLTAAALRPLDAGPRVMPLAVPLGLSVAPPSASSDRIEEEPDRPRDPPRQRSTRTRAPPA